MYKKARAGLIKEFTGISSPYEAPENPELTVNTGGTDVDACVQQVINKMTHRAILADA
jgi:adenylylsulfate kinase